MAFSIGPAASAAPPGEILDKDVRITRVTADPGAGSGILAFAVEFTGLAAGKARTYFIPFMGSGQPRPNVGERCAVHWRWSRTHFNWMLADGRQISGGRLVSRFRCGGGVGK